MATVAVLVFSTQSCKEVTKEVKKSHGGGLKVETKEGEGSAFIIRIPV